MLKLLSHELSGNSYKVRLLLSFLKLNYQVIRIDLIKEEHKKPEFLKINPMGQVPVLIDGETIISDAQAILVYLARKYSDQTWLPTDAKSLSLIVRWLSTTAGEIRQGVEFARLFHLFSVVETIDIKVATQKSHFILKQIEQHLSDRLWLELARPTIADIAVFPYIFLASEGQISLAEYPNIQCWIERIKQLPNFVGMKDEV